MSATVIDNKDGSQGELALSMENSAGKVFTLITGTQAWDLLDVEVTNGNGETYKYNKNSHQLLQILKPIEPRSAADMAYATGQLDNGTVTIKVTDRTTNRPTQLKYSYDSTKGGFVNTLTVVAEDRPHNASMVDFNDVMISLTWYKRRG